MSRPLSVAQMKRKGQQYNRILQPRPRAGTRIRKIYDYLLANRGRRVLLSEWAKERGMTPYIVGTSIIQLRDFYNLDIRAVGRSVVHPDELGRGASYAWYCLVGEWEGRVYIDYLAERMDAQSQSKENRRDEEIQIDKER